MRCVCCYSSSMRDPLAPPVGFSRIVNYNQCTKPQRAKTRLLLWFLPNWPACPPLPRLGAKAEDWGLMESDPTGVLSTWCWPFFGCCWTRLYHFILFLLLYLFCCACLSLSVAAAVMIDFFFTFILYREFLITHADPKHIGRPPLPTHHQLISTQLCVTISLTQSACH